MYSNKDVISVPATPASTFIIFILLFAGLTVVILLHDKSKREFIGKALKKLIKKAKEYYGK